MNNTSDITRKIRALLDKAERSEYAHERDAFTAKAMALMAEHQITNAMIEAQRNLGSASETLLERTIILGSGPYVRARLSLLTSVAQANGCKVLTAVRAQHREAYVNGFLTDVDRTELMFTSLLVQAVQEANRQHIPTGLRAVAVRRSFLFGFATRIDERLAAAKADASAAYTSSDLKDAPSVAMVLADRDYRVDAYITKRYGKVRSMGNASPIVATGFAEGRHAASRADIGVRRLDHRLAIEQ